MDQYQKGKHLFENSEVIYSYTRAQAIEDGVLVDAGPMAKESGITYPVALTRSVWMKYVEVPKGLEGLQDESGRLWDILFMLRHKIMATNFRGTVLTFPLNVKNTHGPARLVELKAVCGPGDDLKPVITVMLPDED